MEQLLGRSLGTPEDSFNRAGPGCRLKRIEKKLGEQMETRRDFSVKNCGYQAKGVMLVIFYPEVYLTV